MAPDAGKTSTIPSGQYKVVSIALDLTGKKLIDEICHIGAYYYPEKTFSQYVMPHRDVSRSAIRTHGIRIFTNYGKYRVLKEATSLKTLRTKSEYSTLCEFMDWLKEAKGESNAGVILAFHDNNRENVTPFLMEALERYKMTDDFFKIVPGFVNISKYISGQEELKEHGTTLRSLCRKLLPNAEVKEKDNNPFSLQSAKDRAKFTFLVLQKLIKSEGEVNSNKLVEFGTVREDEMQNLEKQRELTGKVRSLRPIFYDHIRKGMKERSRAVTLRRYLIDQAVDYETLHKAYETGSKEAVVDVVSKTLANKKEKDMGELVEMIMIHFQNGGVKKDMNGNLKEIGQGEPASILHENGASASSTETDDEEFEEAQDEGIIEK